MTGGEIDDYLAGLDEPARTTLAGLRATIRQLVPDAEECISYGMPAFRVQGCVVAGFAAFRAHCSYFPHSGSVLTELGDDLAGYTTSKGTLRFGRDQPLPEALVARLLAVRMHQAGLAGPR